MILHNTAAEIAAEICNFKNVPLQTTPQTPIEIFFMDLCRRHGGDNWDEITNELQIIIDDNQLCNMLQMFRKLLPQQQRVFCDNLEITAEQ